MAQGARLDPRQIYHLFKHFASFVVQFLGSHLVGQRSMHRNYRSKTDSIAGKRMKGRKGKSLLDPQCDGQMLRHCLFLRRTQYQRTFPRTLLSDPKCCPEVDQSLPTDREFLVYGECFRLTESCASMEKQCHEFIRSSLSSLVSLAHHERIHYLKPQTSLEAADTKYLRCSCSCQHHRSPDSVPHTHRQGWQSYYSSFVGISLFEIEVQMHSYILLKV